MAKALDVSPAYLCKVEKGIMEPTDRFKKECAVFLKTTVAELFPEKKVDAAKIETLSKREKSKKTRSVAAQENNLWRFRRQKGVQQNDLAATLGCSPSYLSKVEKGHSEPTDEFRKRCAKALKVKESLLFPG
jgi:transcriptional regulator with XRE-family HTH domain